MSELNRVALGKLPTVLKKAVYITLHSPVGMEFMQCFFDVSTVDMSRITTLSNDCIRRQRARMGVVDWPFMDVRRGINRGDGLTWERIAEHRIRFMDVVRGTILYPLIERVHKLAMLMKTMHTSSLDAGFVEAERKPAVPSIFPREEVFTAFKDLPPIWNGELEALLEPLP